MAATLSSVARVGDIVLLEPKHDADNGAPLSQSVVVVDESPFSHAMLLSDTTPPYTALSANEAIGDFVSGVNEVDLTDIASNRRCVVVRARGVSDERAAAAVAWALGMRDTLDVNPSDFAWEQLTLSALAGLGRQMATGSLGRAMVWDAVHSLSWRISALDWTTRRWDCCEFVVRCFDEAGASLGIAESDPPVRHAGMAARELFSLWTEFANRKMGGFFTDDFAHRDHSAPPHSAAESALFDAFDDDDHPSLFGELRTVQRLLDRVAQAIEHLVEPDTDPKPPFPPKVHDPAWPPFVSPRMVHAACRPIADYAPGQLR